MPSTKRAFPQAQLQLFWACVFSAVSSGQAALNALYLGNEAGSSSFLRRATKVSVAAFLECSRAHRIGQTLLRPYFHAANSTVRGRRDKSKVGWRAIILDQPPVYYIGVHSLVPIIGRQYQSRRCAGFLRMFGGSLRDSRIRTLEVGLSAAGGCSAGAPQGARRRGEGVGGFLPKRDMASSIFSSPVPPATGQMARQVISSASLL